MSALLRGMVGSLAEVVLRVKNLDAMQTFYADVLGLTLWRRFGDEMAFFKLPALVGGRPQAIALFVDSWPSNTPGQNWTGLDASKTTIHHFALMIAVSDLQRASSLLRASAIVVTERTFPWAGWRSLMLQDPEGNVVELVAEDHSLTDEIAI